MIKKNELMVGSIVEYEMSYHIVREIHGDKVLHSWLEGPDNYFSAYETISGFPITPEFLSLHGFIALPKGPYTDKTAWVVGEDANRLVWSAGHLFKPLPDGFIRISQHVEHIHQFQMLFWALFNEHLPINL